MADFARSLGLRRTIASHRVTPALLPVMPKKQCLSMLTKAIDGNAGTIDSLISILSEK
jgi:hypothetical protein